MTSEQMDEIEKMAEAATPGPWKKHIKVDFGLTMAEYYACGPYHWSREFDEAALSSLDDGNGKEKAEADAAFIVALREHALPMVKALREALSLKQQWAADADAKEALLQSVAKVCRGMKEPDEADLSVLGNVLRERDEARAELTRLRNLILEAGVSEPVTANLPFYLIHAVSWNRLRAAVTEPFLTVVE